MQLKDPEELALKDAANILEGTCLRVFTMQAQIRRSMVAITIYNRGRKQVRIRGNVKHMLKLSNQDINSHSFCFTQNMYTMKRNRTAEELMEGLEGDRERKALEEEDKVKLDHWSTLSLDQLC